MSTTKRFVITILLMPLLFVATFVGFFAIAGIATLGSFVAFPMFWLLSAPDRRTSGGSGTPFDTDESTKI
jgi:hypothetical protein